MIDLNFFWSQDKALKLNTAGLLTWIASIGLQSINQYVAIAGFILSLVTFIFARLYQVKENKIKMKNMELDQHIKELEIEKLEKELNNNS
jgi:hypothetical protein